MKRGAKQAQSPCIGVCRLDPKSGWCLGCGRNTAEIKGWVKLTPFRRKRLERELPRRLAKLGPHTPADDD